MSFVVSISPEVIETVLINGTHLKFTYSKLTIKVLEKVVKYVKS